MAETVSPPSVGAVWGRDEPWEPTEIPIKALDGTADDLELTSLREALSDPGVDGGAARGVAAAADVLGMAATAGV